VYRPPPLRGAPVLAGKTVLLIDRNQTTREARAAVLWSHGIEVHEAESLRHSEGRGYRRPRYRRYVHRQQSKRRQGRTGWRLCRGDAEQEDQPRKFGEKVYVTTIDVKDDEVHYYLMSCDTFEVNVQGSSKQTRYVSFLNFQFPKSFLESADANAVKKTVDAVIAPEADVKAASTKSVELGQTPEPVEAALERPKEIVIWVQRRSTSTRT
jgi:hypothetical protein